MIDYLEGIDRAIVYTVNQWHRPWLDEVMWIVAGKVTWIPLYILLGVLAYIRMPRRTFWIFLACTIAAVGLADLCSVHLFKNVFQRYRPSHHALLTERLHFYTLRPGEFYKGGMFGFVSSHAANFFSLAVFTGLALRPYYRKLLWILLGIAVLVAFSRLYQGVHYLSDLLGGALLGSLISLVIYKFMYLRLTSKR